MRYTRREILLGAGASFAVSGCLQAPGIGDGDPDADADDGTDPDEDDANGDDANADDVNDADDGTEPGEDDDTEADDPTADDATADDATADDATADDEPGADDSSDDTPGEDDGEEQEAATVRVYSHPDLGEILVDREGMTVYQFDSDEQGAEESACVGDCLSSWPPLLVEEEPTAGDDVTAELNAFERDDGSVQVTANGWPLYHYIGDEEPGATNGQGIRDDWWVLDPDGTPIVTDTDDEN